MRLPTFLFALLLVSGTLLAVPAWPGGVLAGLAALLLWRQHGTRPTPKGLLIAASQLVIAGLILRLVAGWQS